MPKKTQTEEGAASMKITLRGGIIKVYHGTDGDLLYEKKAKIGDWDKIWKAIRQKKLKEMI